MCFILEKTWFWNRKGRRIYPATAYVAARIMALPTKSQHYWVKFDAH